jgi:hypothetical protein
MLKIISNLAYVKAFLIDLPCTLQNFIYFYIELGKARVFVGVTFFPKACIDKHSSLLKSDIFADFVFLYLVLLNA